MTNLQPTSYLMGKKMKPFSIPQINIDLEFLKSNKAGRNKISKEVKLSLLTEVMILYVKVLKTSTQKLLDTISILSKVT
jgi:hypothetical protein